jgi:Fe-S-cluster containining protein
MDNELSWFSEGLKFQCTGCGKCCTGSPGYVFLSDTDIQNLAAHLSLQPAEFARKYTRLAEGQLALIDQGSSGDCIFLKEKRCTAYEARPIQCKTFPWWIHLVRSREEWEAAGQHCEGINHPDAPVKPAVEIEEQCLTYLDNLLEQNFS